MNYEDGEIAGGGREDNAKTKTAEKHGPPIND
jgi:hypothetical protein